MEDSNNPAWKRHSLGDTRVSVELPSDSEPHANQRDGWAELTQWNDKLALQVVYGRATTLDWWRKRFTDNQTLADVSVTDTSVCGQKASSLTATMKERPRRADPGNAMLDKRVRALAFSRDDQHFLVTAYIVTGAPAELAKKLEHYLASVRCD
jgi:hypothetical protein